MILYRASLKGLVMCTGDAVYNFSIHLIFGTLLYHTKLTDQIRIWFWSIDFSRSYGPCS
jgi:hypothetical protein